MRALVTGIAGFVGRHLATLLRDGGFEVCGVDRVQEGPAACVSGIERLVGDVCDLEYMSRVVQEFRPTHVFHLAWTFNDARKGGQSTASDDVLAASVLFEAVRQFGSNQWVLLASSSAVYGSPDDQPIDEDAPMSPTTPYGATKVLTERVAEAFHRKHGLTIIVTRTFNLIGPGVPERLLPGSLAAQIVAAENGGPRAVKVGRLDSSRDYLDVRDAARAYVTLARNAVVAPRVFNVCAGLARSCRELADELLASATVPVELVQDMTRLQVGDVDCQRGSAERLTRVTGWSPLIPFSTSVRDMLQQVRTVSKHGDPSTHEGMAG